ncbi:hypothetical protein [Marinilabilia sp.]|uniref:hypothetical protein n=1 Tax=Marinilabilia sp. TaxID=2021252 RepID=UPI0025BD6162|nr:hypothetical protein [Marinilabilia sp.]
MNISNKSGNYLAMTERRIITGINDSLGFFPVVSIIGPRLVGKTILAKQIPASFYF